MENYKKSEFDIKSAPIADITAETKKKEKKERENEPILDRRAIEQLMQQKENSLDLKITELTSIEEVEINKEWKIVAQAIIPLAVYEGHFKKQAHVVPFGIIAGAATEAVDVFLTYLSRQRSKQNREYEIFSLARGQKSIDKIDKFIVDQNKKGKEIRIEALAKKDEYNNYISDIEVFIGEQGIAEIKGVSCSGIPNEAIANPKNHPERYLKNKEIISISNLEDFKKFFVNNNFEFWQIEDFDNWIGYLNYLLLRKLCSSDSPILNVTKAIYNPQTSSILGVAEFPITAESAGSDCKRIQKMYQGKPTLPGNVPPTALIGDTLITLFNLDVKNQKDLESVDKNPDIINQVPVANRAGNVERFTKDKLIQTPCQIIIEARIIEKKQIGKVFNFLLNMNMYLDGTQIGEMKNINYKCISKEYLDHIGTFFREGRLLEKITI